MRREALLSFAAVLLLLAVPFVPMFRNPTLFGTLGASSWGPTCSLLDCAHNSARLGGRILRPRNLADEEVVSGCAFALMSVPTGPGEEWSAREPVDGRPEILVLGLLAVSVLVLGARGRFRWQCVPAWILVVGTTWSFFSARAFFRELLQDMPGGPDAFSIPHWFEPWPWLLTVAAVLLLGTASWLDIRAMRAAASARAATIDAFEP